VDPDIVSFTTTRSTRNFHHISIGVEYLPCKGLKEIRVIRACVQYLGISGDTSVTLTYGSLRHRGHTQTTTVSHNKDKGIGPSEGAGSCEREKLSMVYRRGASGVLIEPDAGGVEESFVSREAFGEGRVSPGRRDRIKSDASNASIPPVNRLLRMPFPTVGIGSVKHCMKLAAKFIDL
jgi:hypothetical protein